MYVAYNKLNAVLKEDLCYLKNSLNKLFRVPSSCLTSSSHWLAFSN